MLPPLSGFSGSASGVNIIMIVITIIIIIISQLKEMIAATVAKMVIQYNVKQTFLTSNRSPPSSPPLKVVPPSFEHGLVLLTTLIRGGGGITSTRSRGGQSSQGTVSQVFLQVVVATF